MGGVVSSDWNELFTTLMERYKECKRLKQDASNDEWAVWSGQFNRHCNSLETSTDYGPTSRIFQIWATLNRLLALYKLLASTTQEAGKEGRGNIKKIINKNARILKMQKKLFMEVCL